ncbi:hypothetical protein AURDEDRAFT_169854 [Auricularia subglabra TFB-10046 SS5]|nr:hypothetical protein AURDEDRAFT_169854 [Auricularia subglabra TFB-10046 SS5]
MPAGRYLRALLLSGWQREPARCRSPSAQTSKKSTKKRVRRVLIGKPVLAIGRRPQLFRYIPQTYLLPTPTQAMASAAAFLPTPATVTAASPALTVAPTPPLPPAPPSGSSGLYSQYSALYAEELSPAWTHCLEEPDLELIPLVNRRRPVEKRCYVVRRIQPHLYPDANPTGKASPTRASPRGQAVHPNSTIKPQAVASAANAEARST